MNDLEKLIEAVEVDDVPFGGWSILSSQEHIFASEWARQAHNGSLDAAKALHDALLPEWDWSVKETVEGWLATVSKPINIHTQTEVSFDNGARAWLLAVLRAYAARDAA